MKMKGWHKGTEEPNCYGYYVCAIEYVCHSGKSYGLIKELCYEGGTWTIYMQNLDEYVAFNEVDDGKIVAWRDWEWTSSDLEEKIENKEVTTMTEFDTLVMYLKDNGYNTYEHNRCVQVFTPNGMWVWSAREDLSGLLTIEGLIVDEKDIKSSKHYYANDIAKHLEKCNGIVKKIFDSMPDRVVEYLRGDIKTKKPIHWYCPYVETKQCCGTCCQDDSIMHCPHLDEALKRWEGYEVTGTIQSLADCFAELDSKNEIENKEVDLAPIMNVGNVLETVYNDAIHIHLCDTETGEILALYNERDSIPEWFNDIPVNKWDIGCNMKEELQGGKVVYIPTPHLILYI